METPQQYYRGEASMSAPGAHRAELRALPTEIGALCGIIQGVLIHADIAEWLYAVKFPERRIDDKHIRPITKVLSRIQALSTQPLTVSRQPADRMAGICCHFTLLLSAILRAQGVPARSRVGFGAYFNPGKFEDHWVCEYWNVDQARWILVDAQLDEIQRKTFKIDFDPLDVPRNRFIIAGDAWQMCRSGRANENDFGLTPINFHGLWFIAGNVIRDFAALNRVELLPWDVWGAMSPDDTGLSDENKALIDRAAALTLAGDESLPEIRKLYDSDDRLRAPGTVFNALRNRPEAIAP